MTADTRVWFTWQIPVVTPRPALEAGVAKLAGELGATFNVDELDLRSPVVNMRMRHVTVRCTDDTALELLERAIAAGFAPTAVEMPEGVVAEGEPYIRRIVELADAHDVFVELHDTSDE